MRFTTRGERLPLVKGGGPGARVMWTGLWRTRRGTFRTGHLVREERGSGGTEVDKGL